VLADRYRSQKICAALLLYFSNEATPTALYEIGFVALKNG